MLKCENDKITTNAETQYCILQDAYCQRYNWHQIFKHLGIVALSKLKISNK